MRKFVGYFELPGGNGPKVLCTVQSDAKPKKGMTLQIPANESSGLMRSYGGHGLAGKRVKVVNVARQPFEGRIPNCSVSKVPRYRVKILD